MRTPCFDEHPPPSESFPSPNMAETTSTFTYDSLFLNPESSRLAEVEDMGSTTRHGPVGILTSTQSPFASLPMEGRFTPQTTLLSPLQGFMSSNAHTGVETLENSTPAEGMFDRQTTVDEWRLQVPPSRSQLSTHPEGLTIPQSQPGSVIYSASDFPRSSATSLQTGMGGFSA